MAENMTEAQVIDAFQANSPGLSDAPQQPVGTEAQVEGQDAPQEVEAEPVAQEQQEETQAIEIDPDEPLFDHEVEEGGSKKTQKLSLKELQLGYMRTKDYTQKTQDLARQREELPKLVAKQAQELSASYGKRLSELQALVMKSVAADVQGIDLNKLATEDPLEWVRVSNRHNQIRELLQTIQKEQEVEAARTAEEKKKADNEKWAKSFEILQRDIPNLGPDVVRSLFKAGEEWGFTQDEVAGWNDHRMIKMLYTLSEKKALEAKRPEVEKKVALVTKVLKPGAKQPQRSSLDEAKKTLRKTGKPQDALPIFEALLG